MEQKITIPDGFKLEKISETEYKIVPAEKKLPKTWKEFCESHPLRKGECWINSHSVIDYVECSAGSKRNAEWYNLLPSKEKAEAILALCQLIQLRDCYNDGWRPDWKYVQCAPSIIYEYDSWEKANATFDAQIFSFKSEELRDKFFKNFKDLLDKLKPLYV